MRADRQSRGSTVTVPSSVWGVTDDECQTALERLRDRDTSPEDAIAYWQLYRFYHGQIFLRDQAERAVHLIRGRAS